jgi:hypothetical protein
MKTPKSIPDKTAAVRISIRVNPLEDFGVFMRRFTGNI